MSPNGTNIHDQAFLTPKHGRDHCVGQAQSTKGVQFERVSNLVNGGFSYGTWRQD